MNHFPWARLSQAGAKRTLIGGAIGIMTLGQGIVMPPVMAQEVIQRILTVTGQGEEQIEATEANVNLAVEAQGNTANEVQAEVARRADSVVKFLRSQNVRNLKTTGINLNPNYNYNDGKRRIIGYSASNSVQFTVDANKSGSLLDRAVSAGASRIGGISFKASDSAIKSARNLALQDATKDARSQAQAILSALGFSEKEIVGIQVNGAVPRPIPVATQRFAALEADAAQAPPSPVIAGEQKVRASVTLQIRY